MSITVQEISKLYGTQKALDDVSFEVKQGEIVGFLGPNGAGKSTMMKILTTYLKPDSGRAQVAGFDVHAQPEEVQKRIGYLPEHNPLYLDMYVREYLDFSASVYKIPKKKNRIEEVLETTGLLPESNKIIRQLSKGYRQRVGLANAVLHQPEVLILDEPTTGLDPNQLIEIRQLVRKLGETTTILLSTHIMQEVEALCSRVLILNHGQLRLDAELESLSGNQQQEIIVGFDYRVEPELLQRLKFVDEVVQLQGFVYKVRFDTDQDMRATLF
ncbi:MAG: gliding motility-associated ABC transporter ATP-binding subunit GldA, partial [Flavobacteriaceae bacterium]|nr:gliding motility-associated ABC transporter ATP-binding subunit GldA [Flavobacteriaceae bacterium]